MHITDPVADMLTRVRNANNAKHETVDVPASSSSTVKLWMRATSRASPWKMTACRA